MHHHFQCTLCGAEYDPHQIRYVCPLHDERGILDTVYDYRQVGSETSPQAISSSRDFSIWRYLPLLPLDPGVQYLFPLQVGWTPLYPAKRSGGLLGLSALFLKDEGRNPTASLKDRASAVVVGKARELGVETITTASTGNAGAALAGFAAAAQTPAVIFVPQGAPPAKIAQMLIFGSQVMLVQGNYDQAFDLCLAASQELGWYCRNTAYNPYTAEGKKTAAFEICEQLTLLRRNGRGAGREGWQSPDRIFVSVGDGNIISGLWKGLRELAALGWIERIPKLMGVQAEGSAACYRTWKSGTEEITPIHATTIADSISADLPRDGVRAVRAARATGGAFLTVTDEEILSAIAALAHREGIFAEPAGAAAYAGLVKASNSGMLSSAETIICLITGNGLKDIASAMKVAGEGTPIAPTLDAVRRFFLK